jgi:phosphoglycolate phosphatase-like HAD superfamily hydrolase
VNRQKLPEAILFDFDGVLVDSMHIRDLGYREIFKDFSIDLVNQLIKYHRINGGLSRYVKIRYFYEKLLGREISDNKVDQLAEQFSAIMRPKLKDRSIIINEALSFVKRCYKKIPLHIVSGSEQDELRCVCEFIEIGSYFLTIEGSPTSKNDLVSSVLSSYGYDSEKTILIGDTINDYDAAKSNKVIFYAYNNGSIKDLCDRYIYSFDEVFFN